MKRHTASLNAPRRKVIIVFAMAILVALVCAPTPAAASLSDQLVAKIAEARRAEHVRNFDGALAVYEKAMQMDHATPEAMRVLLKNRAELYEQISLFDRAEADLTEAAEVMPEDPTTYGDRGYFYLRRGRNDDALGDFVTGSRLDPQNPLYLYAAARALVAAKNFASAVAFYTEAIKLGPSEGKLYLARAEAYVRLARWPDALADYERAGQHKLASLVERYFLYSGRGYVALVMGDNAGALAYLDRALAIDPDATNVLMWHGFAQERRGNIEAAKRDYERVARLLPDDTTARDSSERVRIALRAR